MYMQLKQWERTMRKPRQLPTIRRTKAQIAVDRIEHKYNNCKLCGQTLGRVENRRNTAKMCGDCRGYGTGGNMEVKELYRELSSKQIEPAEDEMIFEDNPIAVNEVDDMRYIRVQPEVNFGGSGLAEIMGESSAHHRYKDESEHVKKRYSYRNGKA